MKWEVHRVHYATYEELIGEGYEVVTPPGQVQGKPDVVVARELTMEQAIAKARELGFGHSAHPTQGSGG